MYGDEIKKTPNKVFLFVFYWTTCTRKYGKQCLQISYANTISYKQYDMRHAINVYKIL